MNGAGRLRTHLPWLGAFALAIPAGFVARAASVPAPFLFAAILVGLGCALLGRGRIRVPDWLNVAAQAVIGVTLGAYFDLGQLRQVGADWIPVIAISVVTLLLSLLAGHLLAASSDLDRATASLGMLAGGAPGVIAAGADLDADVTLVSFMQYVRLIAIVVTTPLVVGFLLHAGTRDPGSAGLVLAPPPGLVTALLATVALAAAGGYFGQRAHLAAPLLVGPMLLTVAVEAALGGRHSLAPPSVVAQGAFAAMGLYAGMQFTLASARRARASARAMAFWLVALIASSAAMAALVVAVTDIDAATAYLATTPGGITAVMVTALATKTRLSVVFAAQTVRLFFVMVLGPLIVRRMVGAPRPPAARTLPASRQQH